MWVSQGPSTVKANKFGFLNRLGPITLPFVEYPSTSDDYWSNSKLNQETNFISASKQVKM